MIQLKKERNSACAFSLQDNRESDASRIYRRKKIKGKKKCQVCVQYFHKFYLALQISHILEVGDTNTADKTVSFMDNINLEEKRKGTLYCQNKLTRITMLAV